jgi:hypothetical protein
VGRLVDKPVSFGFIEGMSSLNVETFAFNRSDQSFLHRSLRRLAFLVRRETEIAIGDKVDCIHKSKLRVQAPTADHRQYEDGPGKHLPFRVNL